MAKNKTSLQKYQDDVKRIKKELGVKRLSPKLKATNPEYKKARRNFNQRERRAGSERRIIASKYESTPRQKYEAAKRKLLADQDPPKTRLTKDLKFSADHRKIYNRYRKELETKEGVRGDLLEKTAPALGEKPTTAAQRLEAVIKKYKEEKGISRLTAKEKESADFKKAISRYLRDDLKKYSGPGAGATAPPGWEISAPLAINDPFFSVLSFSTKDRKSTRLAASLFKTQQANESQKKTPRQVIGVIENEHGQEFFYYNEIDFDRALKNLFNRLEGNALARATQREITTPSGRKIKIETPDVQTVSIQTAKSAKQILIYIKVDKHPDD